jgi:hypothetical protein
MSPRQLAITLGISRVILGTAAAGMLAVLYGCVQVCSA